MSNDQNDEYVSSYQRMSGGLTAEERRQKRKQNRDDKKDAKTKGGESMEVADERFAQLLAKKEDVLLALVAQINKVYEDKLKRPAPFMTFVLCGMQSAGKSTIMERFLNKPLNIVQEGTGTRCPLDATCIHDSSCDEPICDLSGEELAAEHKGDRLSANQVFERITAHNRKLAEGDRFSTEPLRLCYRSKDVQNMRFVDTPGIISNKSTGTDNRDEIKSILRSTMLMPNTKMCVLLEPKEFATNPIVEFCDETLGGRENWIHKATFLMTKFDKQLEDSRTGGKANNFFREFHDNKCFPHLVITPTLAKEDLPPAELFQKRTELLDMADEYERTRFVAWRQGHYSFCQEHGEGEEDLNEHTRKRIGFWTAKKIMRQVLLEDTVSRLPEVLIELRKDLEVCEKEEKMLLDKRRFSDPKELRDVTRQVLLAVETKLLAYLDGDLESTMKFPRALQTLDDEIDEEEESDWAGKYLNFHSEKENARRDRISNYEGDYPKEVQAENRFLGGKQYQRAIEFFRVVMLDSLPDPYQLRDKVSNSTGYLAGGLQRENWERAMVQITKVCIKDVSHPGINYLIKHVGSIFRRLFGLAMDDIKHGEEFSAVFKLLPSAVEKYMVHAFEDMLWALMRNAGDKTHCSLEPMYSTVDPSLPTFCSDKRDDEHSTENFFVKIGEEYTPKPKSEEIAAEGFASSMIRKLRALKSGSGNEAKAFLKTENNTRATRKNFFLPDERTSMITSDETEKILQRSFEYIVGLVEFNLVILKFQLNHYLYEGFKIDVKTSFSRTLANDADWATMVEPDPAVDERLGELGDQIQGLRDSLSEVQRIQRNF